MPTAKQNKATSRALWLEHFFNESAGENFGNKE